MIYIFLTLISVGFLTLVGDVTQMYWLYMISIVGIMVIQREQTPTLHLCAGLLLLKAIELLLFFILPTRADLEPDIAPVWLNLNNYLIHIFLDFCVFCYVAYRPTISRKILPKFVFPADKRHTEDDITFTVAEAWLLGIMTLYFLVDFVALAENLVRNMDYLGVDKELAEYFWNWTLVYELYPSIKNFLNLFELVVIWMVATPKGGRNIPRENKMGVLLRQ